MNRKVLIGCLVGAAGVAGLITFGLHQLLDDSDVCEDVTMQETLSPDAHLKAAVYSRSCGVFTTGLTTQVTIVGANERLPKELGNVCVVRGEDSQPMARVHWNGSRSLSVEEDSGKMCPRRRSGSECLSAGSVRRMLPSATPMSQADQ